MKDNDMLSHAIIYLVSFRYVLNALQCLGIPRTRGPPTSLHRSPPSHDSIAIYLFTCAIQRYHLSKRNDNLLINFIARGTWFFVVTLLNTLMFTKNIDRALSVHFNI